MKSGAVYFQHSNNQPTWPSRLKAIISPLATLPSLLVAIPKASKSGKAHIAAIARYRFPGSAVPTALSSTFKEMGALDVELAKKCVQILKNTDVDQARQIQAEDARVDELHRHVFDVVLADDWKENAMFTVDVTLASRYHERFADHVVDISAKVSYLTTGEWNETE